MSRQSAAPQSPVPQPQEITLDSQSITAMLEPLREPAPISWWPPAPGWWVVAVLVIVALGFLLRWVYRFHRRGAPLREALLHLDKLQSADLGTTEKLSELVQLQRRLAIRIRGRAAAASLTGQAWANFLNAMTPSSEEYFDAKFAEAPYRTELSPRDCQQAFEATRRWLAELERPR